MRIESIVTFLLATATFFSCTRERTLFSVREGSELGIDFQNTILTNDTLNALSFEYIYNGAGIGVGDFNQDGLPDLYFGGNQVSSGLYLNKGNLSFEDITDRAGVGTAQWITGVTVVDINADGFPDIYLSAGGETTLENRRNLLFINQGVRDGVPHSVQSASTRGLASEAYSTMAASFDFDRDGDLDMYLLNDWREDYNRNHLRPRRGNGEADTTDQRFRHNGENPFSDISLEVGFLSLGCGLGVVVSDDNFDGY